MMNGGLNVLRRGFARNGPGLFLGWRRDVFGKYGPLVMSEEVVVYEDLPPSTVRMAYRVS